MPIKHTSHSRAAYNERVEAIDEDPEQGSRDPRRRQSAEEAAEETAQAEDALAALSDVSLLDRSLVPPAENVGRECLPRAASGHPSFGSSGSYAE
jgi:hypothetical protein